MNADMYMFSPHVHVQGYYDTYYEKCIKLGFKPKTIGECRVLLYHQMNLPIHIPALAYACVRCEDIPTHEHDTLIDKVIFSN